MIKTFLACLLILSHSAFAAFELCPGIIFDRHEKFKFSDTEKKLLCGDKSDPAYAKIPPYQAQFSLTGFLQSRGYLRPQFEIKDEVLHVKSGSKSKLKKVMVEAAYDRDIAVTKRSLRRHYVKKLITPSLLTEMEKEALGIARSRGYPCAEVKSEASALSDEATVRLAKLTEHRFGEYEKEKVKGLNDNALKRFYAFKETDLFDENLLILTEKRMLRTEVVQGTYFLETCSPDASSFKMSQSFIEGPPRTLRFGAGASTEVGPMARARWSHNRFGPMASQLSAVVQASLRGQSLILSTDNYLWKDKPRQSLLGQMSLERESQFNYEQLVYKLRPHMKWTRDTVRNLTQWTLGPSFQTGTFHSDSQPDTRSFVTGGVEGSFQSMSHDYEIFDLHPEKGESSQLGFDFRHPLAGSGTSLLKLDSTFVKLDEVGVWGRGSIVGGGRLNAGTTIVPERTEIDQLQPDVKYFGGGSDDVRGYLLRTLPRNNGLGALTKLELKLELRRTKLFIDSIEAFTFLDAAHFGERSWTLDSRLWYSPGLGVRWTSPIGLVQGYAARALATNRNEDFGNFFYAGLGGVF